LVFRTGEDGEAEAEAARGARKQTGGLIKEPSGRREQFLGVGCEVGQGSR
jgi:hypothetical protein